MGARLNLKREQSVAVKARAMGRHDFGGLELVLNGRTLETVVAKPVGKNFEATLTTRVSIARPSWMATRVSGGGTGADGNQVVPSNAPKRGSGKNVNEMGETLFAHTSPVYLDVDNQSRFHLETAEELIAEMEVSQSLIREKGAFESRQQLEDVLEHYRAAISDLRHRIEAHSSGATQ